MEYSKTSRKFFYKMKNDIEEYMNITKKVKPIHPFAARMAPEIAFDALEGLPEGSLVLDPMAGSGTVLRTISEFGFRGVGIDIDPLSVLMAKAWTTKIDEELFLKNAGVILNKALKIKDEDVILPWIDEDVDTLNYINFWFAPSQIKSLRKLSFFIDKYSKEYSSLYKVALSRLIITKNRGASLAADISHSRPHRVRTENDYDVFSEFESSCLKLARNIHPELLCGDIKVRRGDARNLRAFNNNSVDSIITSPPYLNALDYMRGHKPSLRE